MNVAVVIATYNERDNLADLAAAILHHPDYRLIIVDDNSPDGTGAIADSLSAACPERVAVIHRTGARGLGRSLIEGMKRALADGADLIFEMDADFSHDPAHLATMAECAGDADLVIGSRYLNGIRIINWPLGRLMLSKGAATYVRTITGMPFTDPTGGYKCFRRRALAALNLDDVRSNGYSFQIELTHKLWRQGMRIVEVPIVFTDRFQGHSKMSGHIIREALFMVWRLWFQNGMRRRPRGQPQQPPKVGGPSSAKPEAAPEANPKGAPSSNPGTPPSSGRS